MFDHRDVERLVLFNRYGWECFILVRFTPLTDLGAAEAADEGLRLLRKSPPVHTNDLCRFTPYTGCGRKKAPTPSKGFHHMSPTCDCAKLYHTKIPGA